MYLFCSTIHDWLSVRINEKWTETLIKGARIVELMSTWLVKKCVKEVSIKEG